MASRRSVNFDSLPPASQVRTYNVSQVIQLLEKANLSDCSRVFEKRQINGAMLLNLKDDDIMPWVGTGDLKVTHLRQISGLIKNLNITQTPVVKTAKPVTATRSFELPAARNPNPMRSSLAIKPRPPFSQKPMITGNRPSSFVYKNANISNVAKPELVNIAPKPKIEDFNQDEDEYEIPITHSMTKPAPPPSMPQAIIKPGAPSFRAPAPPSFLAKIQQQQQVRQEQPQQKQQEKHQQRENAFNRKQETTTEEYNVYSNWEDEQVPQFKVPTEPPSLAEKLRQQLKKHSKEEKVIEEEDIYSNCEDEQVYDVPNNIPVVFPFTTSQVPLPPLVQGTKVVEEEDAYEVPIVPPSSTVQPIPVEDKGKGFMTTLRSKLFSINSSNIPYSEKDVKQAKTSSASVKGSLQATSLNVSAVPAQKSKKNLPRPLPPLPPSEQDLVVGAGLSRCSSADSFSSDSEHVPGDPNSRGVSVSPLREVTENSNFEDDPLYENKAFPAPPQAAGLPSKPAKDPTAGRQNASSLPSTPVSSTDIQKGLTLSRQVWYRRLNRKDAERLLTGCGDDGRYLVRPSNHGGADSPYTLSLLYRRRVYHILVRQRPDGQYALGREKEKEVTFSSVPLLIAHYRTEPLQLQQQDGIPGDKACLTLPPP